MKLFNKEDILTIITADKAKIGDKGYFGNCIYELEEAIKGKKIDLIDDSIVRGTTSKQLIDLVKEIQKL